MTHIFIKDRYFWLEIGDHYYGQGHKRDRYGVD